MTPPRPPGPRRWSPGASAPPRSSSWPSSTPSSAAPTRSPGAPAASPHYAYGSVAGASFGWYSYGLSRNGYVPRLFEKTDKRKVPWFGLLVAFVIGCIAFLPFPSWKSLVGFVTSASVLMYAGAPLAVGALRQQDEDRYRPFTLRGGAYWSPIAFAVAGFIIYWSGWDTPQKLGWAILSTRT